MQVNGRLRGTITVPAGATAAETLPIARQAVTSALQGQTVVKEIYVPDRIVNFCRQTVTTSNRHAGEGRHPRLYW